MTMTRWTMREIITVHWDGRLPEGKIRILTITIKSRRFFRLRGSCHLQKKIIDRIGDFDEEHFAYLEDLDIGYRARIFGYQNWYAPKAKVYHVGSGTSGSRYNQFKIRYSSRNNIYLIYKNMPFLQIVLNLPFLLVGFGAKILFLRQKALAGVSGRN